MILADTSVWIELLNARTGLRLRNGVLSELVTCVPVVQEVLQGLRDTRESTSFREAFAAIPRVSDPLPASVFGAAAEIYRLGRQRGFTIRSSADCLIAAIAIENRIAVWHRDRDFRTIARYTPLQALDRTPRTAQG